MSTKKIEFELVVDSKTADTTIEHTTRNIKSISSNLNISLAKVEELKKLLASTGDDFPAIEALKALNAELGKSRNAIARLKDSDVKSLLSAQLSSISSARLPANISELLRRKESLEIGDLSSRLIASIERAYSAKNITPAQPSLTEADLKTVERNITEAATKPASAVTAALASLEQEIANNRLRSTFGLAPLTEARDTYLPHLKPQQPTAEQLREIEAQKKAADQLEQLAAELKSVNSAFKAYHNALAKTLPVDVLTSGNQRHFELQQLKAQAYGIPLLAHTALSNAQTSISASESLFNKYKPTTLYNRQLNELEALTSRHNEVYDGSTAWNKTANAIQEARNQLESYRKVRLFLELEDKTSSKQSAFEKEIAAIKGARTAFTDLRDQYKELILLKRQALYGGLDDAERNKLLADIDKTQASLKQLKELRIQQTKNIKANEILTDYSSNFISDIDRTRHLEAIKSRYGANSSQAIDTQEALQLSALKAKYTKELKTQTDQLTPSTTDDKRARIAKAISGTTAAYKQESAAILQNSAILRENSLAIQARQAANQSLFVKISEFVVGYRLINAAINSITSAIRSIPEIGITFDSTKATLESLYVTTSSVQEQFSFLNAVAERTGGRLRSLRTEFADFSASAIAAGESTKNVHQSFADLLDVATVLHLPEDKVHSAFVAISQMYAKNQVMAEELKRQLGNALPGAVALFARSQNLSTADLLKQMKEGQILPKDAVPQFLSVYKQIMAPEGAFATASQGLNANLGRMQNQYTLLIEDVYKRSTGTLIGFTKLASSGLETIRENLSGISLILKEIGALAAAYGLYALFRGVGSGIAKAGIASEATLIAKSNKALPAGATPTALPSATNIDTLAKYSGWGALAGNLLLIAKANPAIIATTTAITGLTYALNEVSSTKYNVGDNIKLTGLEIAEVKLDSFIKKLKSLQTYHISSFLDSAASDIADWADALLKNPASSQEIQARIVAGSHSKDKITNENWAAYLQGELSLNKAISKSYEDRYKAQIEGSKKATSSILTDAELAVEKTKQANKDAAKAYADMVEETRLKTQKLLLQEPVSKLDDLFDNKAFTRNIELVGRAVELQIAKVSQIANQQIALLEAQLNRIDKLAARGKYSPGHAYEEKLRLLSEEYNTRLDELSQKRRYSMEDIKANMLFGQANNELQKSAATVTEKKDYALRLQQIGEGASKLILNGVEKEFKDLGAFVKEGSMPQTELQALKDKINKSRQAFRQALNTPEGVASKVTDFTLGMPELVYKEDIDKAQKAAEAAIAAHEKLQKELTNRITRLPSFSTSDYEQAPRGIYSQLSGGAIFAGMMGIESKFNSNAVSPKGARGLMQLLPSTARNPSFDRYKIEGIRDNSDSENVRVGTAYFSALQDYYSRKFSEKSQEEITRLALTAYNAGYGTVNTALKANNNDTERAIGSLSAEGRAYANKVLTAATKPKTLEAYNKLAQSFDSLKEDLAGTNVFNEKNRSSASAAASTTFRGQTLLDQEAQQRNSEQFNTEQRANVFREDFEQAQLDFMKSIQQQILQPYAELTQPNSYDSTRALYAEQTRVIRSTLQDELKTSPDKRTIKTDEAIYDLIAKLDAIAKKREDLFNLGLSEQRAQANTSYVQARISTQQATLRYQSLTPMQKAFADAENAQDLYKTKLAEREASFAKLDASSLLPEQIKAQKEAITSELESLKTQSEGVATYFSGEFASALQQPFADMITSATTAQEAIKAFGTNIVKSLVNDFTSAISKDITSVFSRVAKGAFNSVTGGGKNSDSSIWSSVGSSVAGWFGYASGGEVTTSGSQANFFGRTTRIVGPGSGTSDSIPVLVRTGSYVISAAKAKTVKRVNLSNGEILVSPEDTRAIGRANLDALNFGANLASGGSVDGGNPMIKNSNSTSYGRRDTYHVNIVQNSSGNAAQDGELAASAFIKAVISASAKQEAARALALHRKKEHS